MFGHRMIESQYALGSIRPRNAVWHKISTLPRDRRFISSKVEVERKFRPESRFRQLFNHDCSAPVYLKLDPTSTSAGICLLPQPNEYIRDTYYDTPSELLFRNGIWVRQRRQGISREGDSGSEQRPAIWNAKMRIAGDFANSQMVEVEGREAVEAVIKHGLRSAVTQRHELQPQKQTQVPRLRDLNVVSDLVTRRHAWRTNSLPLTMSPEAQLTIVLDSVTEASRTPPTELHDEVRPPFEHLVGEVELFQTFTTGEGMGRDEHEQLRNVESARRMEELEKLMGTFPDIFVTKPRPIGKLEGFTTWTGRLQ